MSTLHIAHHTTLAEWAKAAVAPLPAICATAAALAGLAEVEWTPLMVKRDKALEIWLDGRLGAAYTGRTARVWVARYARHWGNGRVDVRRKDGRLIAETFVAVEGYAPARVWADLGPAPLDLPVVRSHYERLATAAQLGPGVA